MSADSRATLSETSAKHAEPLQSVWKAVNGAFRRNVVPHALIDSKNSAAAATLRIVLVPFSFICSPCEDFREGRGSFDSFLRLPTRPNVRANSPHRLARTKHEAFETNRLTHQAECIPDRRSDDRSDLVRNGS